MNNTNSFLCKDANQLDIVDLLGKLGFAPAKVNGSDYWYLSPLRTEKTASFKVNRSKNVWYDHGTGQGGTLVDLALRFYNCSIVECLFKIQNLNVFSFQKQATPSAFEKEKNELNGKLKIANSIDLNDPGLVRYLEARKIDLSIARHYCSEVSFEFYNRQQKALGFKNNAGGYELRSAKFKGSSSPKQPRLITSPDTNSVAVFEGFFSFLSYQTLKNSKQIKLPLPSNFQEDYFILNSIAFFEKSRSVMENYSVINLYLDQDHMGISTTEKALKWSDKYKDRSQLYAGFKDLNDYLVDHSKPGLTKSRRQGRRL